MLNESTRYFSPDYLTARERFRKYAEQAGAELHSLPLTSQSPEGKSLSIDIAWLGNDQAKRVCLHSSGLHGVEGFAGSAVQLKLLHSPPEIPYDGAIILVHIINPYGMAWLRRTNNNNVDLNRNYLINDGSWSGVSDAYRKLNDFLNPESPPRFDFFYPRLIGRILQSGFQSLKQSVVSGQYEYAKGLFYGGDSLQEELTLYQAWLQDNLANIDYLMAIDAHTGLGKNGTESLFMEDNMTGSQYRQLVTDLKKDVELTRKTQIGYTIRGGLSSLFNAVFSSDKHDFLIQECGTLPPLKILHVLREENRYHFYTNGGINHPVKERMKAAFSPESLQWQQMAVNNGCNRLKLAIRYVFNH